VRHARHEEDSREAEIASPKVRFSKRKYSAMRAKERALINALARDRHKFSKLLTMAQHSVRKRMTEAMMTGPFEA
jgi:hypothetical protein